MYVSLEHTTIIEGDKILESKHNNNIHTNTYSLDSDRKTIHN